MVERNDPPWGWLTIPPRHLARYAGTDAWDERTVAQQAADLADADPGFVAFVEGATSVTRADVVAEAEALCAALHARGLRAGDVIAFQVPNWREAATINLAAALSGLIVNPIVPIYRDHEVSQMLADCRASAVFVAARFRKFDYAAMASRLSAQLPDLRHIFTVRGDGPDDFASLVAEGRGARFDRPVVDPLGVKMVLYTSRRACCTATSRSPASCATARRIGACGPATQRSCRHLSRIFRAMPTALRRRSSAARALS